MLERLNNKSLFDDACVYGTTTCFTKNDKHINFTKAFNNEELLNLGLKDSILRNVPIITDNLITIIKLIDEIPNEFNNIIVCSDIQKKFIIE